MSNEFKKRKSLNKNKWLFYLINPDYKSKYYDSEEERDLAIEEYITLKKDELKKNLERISMTKDFNE